MYNANRLARSARKAERDGRTFEATSLWGQVATKAESVVVRHPTSKYAEEAAILRGVAFARVLDSKNPARRREAHFQRARTLRYLGNYTEAIRSLEDNREPRAARERLLSLAG